MYNSTNPNLFFIKPKINKILKLTSATDKDRQQKEDKKAVLLACFVADDIALPPIKPAPRRNYLEM